MGETVDVKALRAKFSNSETNSRDSGSPKSPRPGIGRAILPMKELELALKLPLHHPPSTSPGPVRYPKPDSMAASVPLRPGSTPRNPPVSPVRPYLQPAEPNKIKHTGEMLQNLMLRHQGPNFSPMALGLTASLPQGPGVSPNSTPIPHRQKSLGEVTPLRKPLPVEGAMPLKPKRPPFVNLEPYLRFRRGPAIPLPKRNDEKKMPLSSVAVPPLPPQRSSKPTRLPCQVASVDIDDEKDTYDDIGSFDKNDSDNSLQCVDEEDDVYEFIDEEVETNSWIAEDKNKQYLKKQQDQERRPPLEHHMKMNELRRNFQLQGEIKVLQSTRARQDWSGGSKLDLSVRQGEILEILRVTNNPEGKWLARTLNGNYGYISYTCVDLNVTQTDPLGLPPPPPDPDSQNQDDDDYDDVQPMPDDFPPPPPPPPPPLEISIDPKVEKEIRKKFKYEGSLQAQHIMMVDPNCIIKKPGTKELLVTRGEIVDVIDTTNCKKYLCRNKNGKYGYVPASFLLPMEGDIYDDVEYLDEVYDNDDPN